ARGVGREGDVEGPARGGGWQREGDPRGPAQDQKMGGEGAWQGAERPASRSEQTAHRNQSSYARARRRRTTARPVAPTSTTATPAAESTPTGTVEVPVVLFATAVGLAWPLRDERLGKNPGPASEIPPL